MAVIVKNNVFILETKNTHYVLGVDDYGYNHHLHWGKKCNADDYFVEKIFFISDCYIHASYNGIRCRLQCGFCNCYGCGYGRNSV